MAQRTVAGPSPRQSQTNRAGKTDPGQAHGRRQPAHHPSSQDRRAFQEAGAFHRGSRRAGKSQRTIMAALGNTATTLTTKGIREDLEDTIYRVAPTKTPFQNNIGNGGKATNTYHEWQLEAPDAPSA